MKKKIIKNNDTIERKGLIYKKDKESLKLIDTVPGAVLGPVLIIPDYVEGIKVTTVSTKMEDFPGVTDLVLGDNILAVDEDFTSEFNSISKVTIGECVVFFDFFKNLKNLKEVKVSPHNPHGCVLDGTLYQYPYKTAAWSCSGIFAEGTKVIGPHTLTNKVLKKVTLPSSLVLITSNAFKDCAITELCINSKVETVEEGAFFRCYIDKLMFEEQASTIDEATHLHMKTNSIFMSQIGYLNIQRIDMSLEESSFAHCDISTLEMAHVLLGTNSFNGCFESLKKVLIPVQEIRDNFLRYDSSFMKMALKASKAITLEKTDKRWHELMYW